MKPIFIFLCPLPTSIIGWSAQLHFLRRTATSYPLLTPSRAEGDRAMPPDSSPPITI